MTSLNNSTPVRLPYYQFTIAGGDAFFNAKIYVGRPNTDPEISTNQIDVLAVQQDGSTVVLDQPLRTNDQGYISDSNGNVAYAVISQNYSIKVRNSLDALVYEESTVYANPFEDSFNIEVKTFKPVISPGQTSITVPDAPDSVRVIINGVVQEPILSDGDSGAYTYASGVVTLTESLIGDESVIIEYGLLVFTTGVSSDGAKFFSSVSQMVADTSVSIGDFVTTYMYNSKVINNWNVALSGNADRGDVLLSNGLWAILQIEQVMTPEHYGAYGNGIDDDLEPLKRMTTSGVQNNGRFGANYLVTGQVTMPIGFRFNGNGCDITWNGTAGAITYEGRDWGVFSAIGVLGPVIDQHQFASDIPEFTEIDYPVADQANFTGLENDYLFFFAGSTGSAPQLPSFSVMAQFLGFSGTNAARMDYRSGWTIPSGEGLSITYRTVAPVRDIVLKNFTITDMSPDSGDNSDYASAISFAFAYNCHVSGVRGVAFRNPIIFAQYCTDCTVSDGRIERPQETGGGQGYYTQWSYSLRSRTSGVTGYLCRHICDHTKCAYCYVDDCGDTNTADGAYTNHGAYEHDITYTNCVGWHSAGNSGPSFGESCKRINIINGRGVALTAGRNVIDVSVYNSRFGRVLVNSQGFQADGLIVDNDDTTSTGFRMVSTTTVLGRDTLSLRPNVIKNSSLVFNSGQSLTDGNFTGRVLYLENTELRKINSSFIQTGAVHMDGGSIAGTTAALSIGSDASLKLCEVDTDSFGVRQLLGSDGGYFIVDGGEHTNIVNTGIYSSRVEDTNPGTTTFKLMNTRGYIDGNGGFIIDMPSVTAPNTNFIEIRNNNFTDGTINIANAYSGAGKLIYTENLQESTVTRTIDVTGGRRIIENNIEL